MSNYPTYEINACLLVSHVCSIKCFVLIFAQTEVGKRNDALKCFWFRSSVSKIKFYTDFINIYDFH
jgi:hypothetical protein